MHNEFKRLVLKADFNKVSVLFQSINIEETREILLKISYDTESIIMPPVVKTFFQKI